MTVTKTNADIEFISKVQELGEHGRVVNMCRSMLARLPRESFLDQVVKLRSMLVRSLREQNKSDEDLEPEKESLARDVRLRFEKYLAVSDRAGAARWMLDWAREFNDRDLWTTLTRLVDLFTLNSDPAVLGVVMKAYDQLIDICPGDDPDFFPLCERYAEFLHKPQISEEVAIDELDRLRDYYVELERSEDFIAVLEKYIEKRGWDPERKIADIHVECLLDADEFDRAKEVLWTLLCNEVSRRRIIWLFQLGLCFRETGKKDNSLMCFHEVLRIATPEDDHTIVETAREYIGEQYSTID